LCTDIAIGQAIRAARVKTGTTKVDAGEARNYSLAMYCLMWSALNTTVLIECKITPVAIRSTITADFNFTFMARMEVSPVSCDIAIRTQHIICGRNCIWSIWSI